VADLANAQESIEEEQDSKAELQKQLVNAKSEAASWKNKFDSEASPRIEELEDAKYVSIITTAVQGSIVSLLDASSNKSLLKQKNLLLIWRANIQV